MGGCMHDCFRSEGVAAGGGAGVPVVLVVFRGQSWRGAVVRWGRLICGHTACR